MSGGRRRVVVVEDHQESCVAIVRLLGGMGYNVVGARSVCEAKQLVVERHGCDVLIADIGLPDGSGLDLLRDLRAVRGLAAIAITGFTDDVDAAACAAAGYRVHPQARALRRARSGGEATAEAVTKRGR
jgi:CheY-like chemotaxis protein